MNERIYNNVMDEDVRAYFSELIGNDEKRGLLADTLSALKLANIGLCRDNVIRLYTRWERIKKDTPNAMQFLETETQTARTELCRQAVDGLKKLIKRFEARPNFQIEVSFAGTGKPRENQIVGVSKWTQWDEIRTMTNELHRQFKGMQAVCKMEAAHEVPPPVEAASDKVEYVTTPADATHEAPASTKKPTSVRQLSRAAQDDILDKLKASGMIDGNYDSWRAFLKKEAPRDKMEWKLRNKKNNTLSTGIQCALIYLCGWEWTDIPYVFNKYFKNEPPADNGRNAKSEYYRTPADKENSLGRIKKLMSGYGVERY